MHHNMIYEFLLLKSWHQKALIDPFIDIVHVYIEEVTWVVLYTPVSVVCLFKIHNHQNNLCLQGYFKGLICSLFQIYQIRIILSFSDNTVSIQGRDVWVVRGLIENVLFINIKGFPMKCLEHFYNLKYVDETRN